MGFSLVFEDFRQLRNIPDSILIENDRPMHDRGSMIDSIIEFGQVKAYDIRSKPPLYMYPIGLYHNSWQWAGHRYNRVCDVSVFDRIPVEVMDDVRMDRAILLFDQVQEGTTVSWLNDWFHSNIARHKLPANNVVYCTGDTTATEYYDRYCNENGITERMHVISDLVIQCYNLAKHARQQANLPDWETQINHKTWNIADIKLYNCLNRRVYTDRQWLYLRLAEEGLVGDGLISMDKFDTVDHLGRGMDFPIQDISHLTKNLPMHLDLTTFDMNPCIDLNVDVYLNSWFSIITETSSTDNGESVMITEKTIKPMLACHPFIVFGNRRILRYLRDLGFKTFANTIDESYDTKYDIYRLEGLIDAIKSIKKQEDMLEWFKRNEDALRHNQELALNLSWGKSTQCVKLKQIWNDLLERRTEGNR